MIYTVDVTIEKPLKEVLALYQDPDNLKKWQPGFISMEPVDGTPGEQGAVSNLKYKMGNREVTMTETILVNNLPKELKVSFNTKGVFNLQKNSFHEIGDNTTRYVSENEFRFSGFAKLYGILMPRAFKKQSQKYLNMFKEFAERS